MTTAVPPLHGVIWAGTARVTMYTCVELGGCNRTASGIWPYEGVVAVDPRVIPLGSMVWLNGLGTFLAADTGSAVYGNRIDVFVHDYPRAIQWGVRYLEAVAYKQ
jgi:3D (Asp-Asp-Asp) domain-containing protein